MLAVSGNAYWKRRASQVRLFLVFSLPADSLLLSCSDIFIGLQLLISLPRRVLCEYQSGC